MVFPQSTRIKAQVIFGYARGASSGNPDAHTAMIERETSDEIG